MAGVWAFWAALALAGSPSALYFYSTTCPYCELFEIFTLGDAEVDAELRALPVRRIDTGEAEAPVIALVKEHRGYVTPTMVFLGPEGEELHRVTGYVYKGEFLCRLRYITGGHWREGGFKRYEEKQGACPASQ
ncbi:MAG: thioredoxin fold domain-containing protein [Nitrospinae bacterium]|nr:thioredoxin fold domain-containing protein [Nitrospinota bacterium]